MSTDNPETSKPGSGAPPQLVAQATEDTRQVAEKVTHDLEAVKHRAADDVRDLQHEAGAKVGEATESVKSFASDQKNLAASQINGVAAAITKVADELEGSDQAAVGRYARELASGLSSFGKTVEERDVDDLMGMAQDFGRKQPVAFLGAAALAGFVASRFALASAHRRENSSSTGSPTASPSSGNDRPDVPKNSAVQPDSVRSGGL